MVDISSAMKPSHKTHMA